MPDMTDVVGLMEFLSKRVQITPNTHLFRAVRCRVEHEFSSKHGCKLLRVFVLFIHPWKEDSPWEEIDGVVSLEEGEAGRRVLSRRISSIIIE